MATFNENQAKLADSSHVNSITLYEGTKKAFEIAGDKTRGSRKVFSNVLGFEDGLISQDDVSRILTEYAEHTPDAQANPGKHSTIDYILGAQQRNLQDLRGVISFAVPADLEGRVRELNEVKKAGKLSEKREEALSAFTQVMNLLEKGYLRTAQFGEGGWKVNDWVKQGIMFGFPLGGNITYGEGDIQFVDKDTLPLRQIDPASGIRVVPPAAGMRRGSYAGKGAILMPPAYINVGAFVGRNTMVENLVGSCAQVGKNSHISAGAIIGGVLDPIEATPVILGDYVLMGEGSGVTQGTRLGDLVTLAPGVHITKATPVIDPINHLAYRNDGIYELEKSIVPGAFQLAGRISEKDSSYGPEVPSGALIVPGMLMSSGGNLRIAPQIAKYIKSPNERAYSLNDDLRAKP